MITEKYKIKERINWMVKNKVNSFSPTISPAPKNKTDNEIESPLRALQYYFERGVTEFIIQKKYMGSYCDIYLKSNIDETYFISRNGYLADHIDTEKAKESCKEIHSKFNWKEYDTIILQAEMMPWAVLGQNLITNDFFGYADAHGTHCDYLKNSDLYSKINMVKSGDEYKEFIAGFDDSTGLKNGKEVDKHVIRQYKSIERLKVFDIENYNNSIQLYQKQINHYGEEGDIHFKAFNVLKKISHNGDEEIVNDNYSYTDVNDDNCLKFTIATEEELKLQCAVINEWLESLTDDMEEGVMIKPRTAFLEGIPPCFKVRNNNYLTMIYGVRFKDEYQRYMKKRNIRKKLESSINQWMINWELLKTKYSHINDDNYYYKNLMYERITGESKMKSIDHRL